MDSSENGPAQDETEPSADQAAKTPAVSETSEKSPEKSPKKSPKKSPENTPPQSSQDPDPESPPDDDAASDAPRKPGRGRLVTVALLGAGVALAVGIFAGQQFAGRPIAALDPTTGATDSTGATPNPNASGDPGPQTVAPDSFVVFRDEESDFEIAYPPDWEVLQPSIDSVKLIAQSDVGDSFLVRVLDLGFTVPINDTQAMRDLADEVITSTPGLELITLPQEIVLGGLPGLFYLYAFDDPETGQRGVHSHYFLFNGDRLTTMVFQSLPLANFTDVAATFDAIANTFQSLDPPVIPDPAESTAPTDGATSPAPAESGPEPADSGAPPAEPSPTSS